MAITTSALVARHTLAATSASSHFGLGEKSVNIEIRPDLPAATAAETQGAKTAPDPCVAPLSMTNNTDDPNPILWLIPNFKSV